MPIWKKRIPIFRRTAVGREILEIEFRLAMRTSEGNWKSESFLLDTGTQLTTISIDLAQRLEIPFATNRAVLIDGAAGKAPGYLAPLYFSMADLPEWQFESWCCFSTSPLKRGLLSATDLLQNFTLRTLLPSHLHPLGSVLLQLRRDHQGQPRDDS